MSYAFLDEVFPPPKPKGQKRAAAAARATGVEGFVGNTKVNQLSTAPPDSYMGKLNDYTFGCKQYGVCPATLKEGFQNPNQKKQPLTRVQAQCQNAQPPVYEVPLNADDKRRYAQTMEIALQDPEREHLTPMRSDRTVDMGQVSGYGDDDLDQYLSVSDLKDQMTMAEAPAPLAARRGPPPTGYDPEHSPFAELLRMYADAKKPAPVSAPATHDRESAIAPMWMDLLFFVILGLLVILIMHQLFKLAMVMGMRQTLQLLEPMLQQCGYI